MVVCRNLLTTSLRQAPVGRPQKHVVKPSLAHAPIFAAFEIFSFPRPPHAQTCLGVPTLHPARHVSVRPIRLLGFVRNNLILQALSITSRKDTVPSKRHQVVRVLRRSQQHRRVIPRLQETVSQERLFHKLYLSASMPRLSSWPANIRLPIPKCVPRLERLLF